MSKEQLDRARELIKKRKFDEAREILKWIPNSPTAVKWLEKLDEIAPVEDEVEPFPISDKEAIVSKRPSHIRQFMKAGAWLTLICIVGAFIVYGLVESELACQDLGGEDKAECIADREVENVRRVDFEDRYVNVAYKLESSVLGAERQVRQDFAKLICELREGGFTSRPFHLIAILDFEDEFGREVEATGIEVTISASNARRINCDNTSNVNFEVIADTYYVHPLIR